MTGEGVDYRLDIFKNSPINSRIDVIWDQQELAGAGKSGSDVDVLYGNVYYNSDINRALAAYEEGAEYENIVPSDDSYGHGTYVAGIAAAAAPESELAVVRLKPAKQYLRDFFFIPDNQSVYEETDIMLGVRFLLDYAQKEQKPLVILVSLATGSGPKTGATPLASVLSYAATRSNVAVVSAVGNEADNRTHISGEVISDNSPYVCELNAGPGEKGLVVELWAGTLDTLSVGFVSPSGEVLGRISTSERKTYTHEFLFEKTTVTVDYQIVEELSGYELVFIRFINPAQGIWRINIYSLTTIQGKFNMWLNMKKLISSDSYFLSSNPDVTILEPSADDRIISVGSYDHHTGGADIDSGRGYSAAGSVKPDFVAPGVNVLSPAVQSDNAMTSAGVIRVMSGTSVAAAHVAGMAALLFQWGDSVIIMSCYHIKYNERY